MNRQLTLQSDFKCAHCGITVSSAYWLSGVRNRNHCPLCLWSRHLDLYQAGDRLSACKATMRPVGLTMKRRRKKYASTAAGELMLVHLCINCGQISINRIAADDDAERIFEIFATPITLQERDVIQACGIHILGEEHVNEVSRQLFGEPAGAAL